MQKDSKTTPPETNGGEKPEHAESPKEIGGRKGLDPTRYGDWELSGKCVDF